MEGLVHMERRIVMDEHEQFLGVLTRGRFTHMKTVFLEARRR